MNALPATVLPRGPVFDWPDLRGGAARRADMPAVDDMPCLQTTSGRAALYWALRLLALPSGSSVLVPTYHCPTMVAPVVLAGLQPRFYGIDEHGLPLLADVEPAGAIIVAHYFGCTRSLAKVRAWCDAHGVALVEDCAHAFFGQAGERPVGHWGDFATASMTKFFAVPEAGLVGSAQRPVPRLPLHRQSWKAEVKGLFNTVEASQQAGRLRALAPVLRLMNQTRQRPVPVLRPTSTPPDADPLQGCDMRRADAAPLAVARWLGGTASRVRAIERRRSNDALLRRQLADLPGVQPLLCDAAGMAPYATPLWADDPEPLYRHLRSAGMPVFRWDQRWPGTPDGLAGDQGPLWSCHVLQLLTHQSLDNDAMARVVDAVRSGVRA